MIATGSAKYYTDQLSTARDYTKPDSLHVMVGDVRAIAATSVSWGIASEADAEPLADPLGDTSAPLTCLRQPRGRRAGADCGLAGHIGA
jgi:hypothetical protein